MRTMTRVECPACLQRFLLPHRAVGVKARCDFCQREVTPAIAAEWPSSGPTAHDEAEPPRIHRVCPRCLIQAPLSPLHPALATIFLPLTIAASIRGPITLFLGPLRALDEARVGYCEACRRWLTVCYVFLLGVFALVAVGLLIEELSR